MNIALRDQSRKVNSQSKVVITDVPRSMSVTTIVGTSVLIHSFVDNRNQHEGVVE